VFVNDGRKRFGGLGQLVRFIPAERSKIGQLRANSNAKAPAAKYSSAFFKFTPPVE